MMRGRDAITLELSGGLDSTALAVALQRAKLNTRTLAITHFDPRERLLTKSRSPGMSLGTAA